MTPSSETLENVSKTIYAAHARNDELWEYWIDWPCGGSHTYNEYLRLAKAAFQAVMDSDEVREKDAHIKQLTVIAHLAANLEIVHHDGQLSAALREWYNPTDGVKS